MNLLTGTDSTTRRLSLASEWNYTKALPCQSWQTVRVFVETNQLAQLQSKVNSTSPPGQERTASRGKIEPEATTSQLPSSPHHSGEVALHTPMPSPSRRSNKKKMGGKKRKTERPTSPVYLKEGTELIPTMGGRSSLPDSSWAAMILIVLVAPEPGFQPVRMTTCGKKERERLCVKINL